MTKRYVFLFPLLIIALVVSVLVPPVVSPPPVQAGSDWAIDGDTVYIDDSNVYLAATPAVLGGSGWVEFELLSKHYEGKIDAVWGFDTAAGIKPSKPQIWKKNVAHLEYRMVGVEKQANVTIYNVTSWQTLGADSVEADIGSANNTHLIELALNQPEAVFESWPNPLVIAFNSYVLHDSSSATFYYSYDTYEREPYIEYYDDWKPFSSQAISTVHADYAGFGDWKFVGLDSAIQKDVLYKVRCWIDIPFKGNETTVAGKYIWAVKPHGESVQQAMSNGHLYMLDPWYNALWAFRETIEIDHTKVDGNQVDFPVYIDEHGLSATFWSNVQADGEDVVFTSDDGNTKLDRELVFIDTANETLEAHVRVPALSGSTNTTLFIYYGNAAAAEVNDTATWNANYKAVYHMVDDPNNTRIKDSTFNANHGIKKGANEPNQVVGTMGYAQDFVGEDDFVNVGAGASLDMGTGDFTLECLATTPAIGAAHRQLVCKIKDGDPWNGYGLRIHTPTGFLALYGHTSLATGDIAIDDDASHYLVGTFDAGTADTGMKVYVDGAEDVSARATAPADDKDTTDDGYIGMAQDGTSFPFNGTIDECRISDIDITASWLNTTNSSLMGVATFYSVRHVVDPQVTTNAATQITTGAARLNAYVNNDGGEPCDVRFWYNLTATPCNATNCNATSPMTQNTTWVNDTYNTGDSPYADIVGLLNCTSYCFKVQIANNNATVNGSALCFFTDCTLEGPTNLEAYPSSSDIDLEWVKGSGSQNTILRAQVGGYPATHADGVEVYNGTTGTANYGSLSPGITYYIRGWGYSDGNVSANYTEMPATTFAIGDPSDVPSDPDTPATWWATPDPTGLSNLPFYPIINDLADDYGIPHTTFWVSLILLAIMASALWIYGQSNNVTSALMWAGACIVVASWADLLPLWMIAAYGVPVAGLMMVQRRT